LFSEIQETTFCAGVSFGPGSLVGDYTNPILKPEAARVVKKYGEMSLAGAARCALHFYRLCSANIAAAGKVTTLYDQDHEIRHVRMNEPHPRRVFRDWPESVCSETPP
jgi:hypothetical protein